MNSISFYADSVKLKLNVDVVVRGSVLFLHSISPLCPRHRLASAPYEQSEYIREYDPINDPHRLKDNASGLTETFLRRSPKPQRMRRRVRFGVT
jgi:hypothetical protein